MFDKFFGMIAHEKEYFSIDTMACRERMRSVLKRGAACVVLLFGLLFFPFFERESLQPVFQARIAPGRLAGHTIGVDAGHGGYDGGCESINGYEEKWFNLQVALLLGKELEARGAKVIYSRKEDIALIDVKNTTGYKKRKELDNRLKIFREGKVECMISVHMNAYSDPRQRGAQLFYADGSAEGKQFADCLVKYLQEIDPEYNRGTGVGDYYILNAVPASILAECGFLTNPEEEKLLRRESFRQTMACALADGVEEYLAEKAG